MTMNVNFYSCADLKFTKIASVVEAATCNIPTALNVKLQITWEIK
jgi:hypothetical protein